MYINVRIAPLDLVGDVGGGPEPVGGPPARDGRWLPVETGAVTGPGQTCRQCLTMFNVQIGDWVVVIKERLVLHSPFGTLPNPADMC